jgi:hypothetical protein
MRKNRLTTGITACGGSERYSKTRLELLKDSQKPDAWWLIFPIMLLITLVLTPADYYNIYIMLTDVLLFTDSKFLCILSAVLCLILSLLPISFAYLIRKRQYRLSNIPTVALISIPAIFIIMIGILGWVRYSSGAEAVSGNLMMQSIGGSAAATHATTASPTNMSMVLLLTCLPIAAGVVNFWLAWWGTDPLLLKIHRLEIHRLRLFESYLVQPEALIAEYLSEDCAERLYREDDGKYSSAMDTVTAIGNGYQNYFKTRLAEHLAKGVSTSFISKTDNLIAMPISDTAEATIPDLMEGTL